MRNIRVALTADIPHQRDVGIVPLQHCTQNSPKNRCLQAFVTGTFSGLIPVTEVDGRRIGDGCRGPLVARLQVSNESLCYDGIAALNACNDPWKDCCVICRRSCLSLQPPTCNLPYIQPTRAPIMSSYMSTAPKTSCFFHAQELYMAKMDATAAKGRV